MADETDRERAHAALDEALRRIARRGSPYPREVEQIIIGCIYPYAIGAAREIAAVDRAAEEKRNG